MSPHALGDLLDRLVGEMVRTGITFDEGRQAFEARFIQHALDRSDGHSGHAARQLGIHRNTLARKVAEYGLRPKS